MKARDIMTQNPRCVTPDDSIQQAARFMRDEDVGSLPVVNDNTGLRVVGMITDRDIAVRAVADGRSDATIGDVMTRGDVRCARENDDVDQVVQLMEREQIRRVPVLDGDDRLVGIIAQADIARQGGISDRTVGQAVSEISEPGGRHDQSR